MSQKRKKETPPPGVELIQTLEGHAEIVWNLVFDPTGQILASGGDTSAKLWSAATGKLLHTLKGQANIRFNPQASLLATTSEGSVTLWDVKSGKLVRSFSSGSESVWDLSFDAAGKTITSLNHDNWLKTWDVKTGKVLKSARLDPFETFQTAFNSDGSKLARLSGFGPMELWDVATASLRFTIKSLGELPICAAFGLGDTVLAIGSFNNSVNILDPGDGTLLHTLEGHTETVDGLAFSRDGRLMVSRSEDGILRLWNCKTWETIAVISSPTPAQFEIDGLAFHPTEPLLASVATKSNSRRSNSCEIRLWKLDLKALLKRAAKAGPALRAVHHTTAKLVLVGDSGVGKTGLGWRLAHGEFKEHASTHGQQFWVLNHLSVRRSDGTECEAILWDLAGQPDYRLIHALFLDDADLALVLFDPTDSRDPLHGVEFWLKQLKAGQKKSMGSEGACSTILVGARTDRGEARLTKEDLNTFCQQRGIVGGYLPTSAKEGLGLDELLRRMKVQIDWEEKPATVTTVTFKRIKDYVLELKENSRRRRVIVTPSELRKRLEKLDKKWVFTDPEMMTAIGHLANYGYVRVLRTSKGEERILISPELLNNLAASIVLEARRNPKGLGSIEEKSLLGGAYKFRELENLYPDEKKILLDSAALLFLKHNICFRETDPLVHRSYLVFPELINLNKPLLEGQDLTEEGLAYTISGSIENVYASLVVLLGYTQTFTRTNQWRNQARYEMGDGLICGFRQEGEREGEVDLVLYFGNNVGRPVRTLFEGLFESFLARRNLSVFRFEPVICSKGHALNRAVVRDETRSGAESAFCHKCGEKLKLPRVNEPIQLTQTDRSRVDKQHWIAEQRTRFEQALFQLASLVESRELTRPECFISYAWGEREQERWVERNLASDLQKAGIRVVLDRWENERIGASVSRFVERIEKCDRVIMVGTPLYRKKYENKDTSTGYVVAAEVDMISNRLLGTEQQKETVLPLLLAGTKAASLPGLLHGRVYADFREDRSYFITVFDLILDLFGILHHDSSVADLRESLFTALARL